MLGMPTAQSLAAGNVLCNGYVTVVCYYKDDNRLYVWYLPPTEQIERPLTHYATKGIIE